MPFQVYVSQAVAVEVLVELLLIVKLSVAVLSHPAAFVPNQVYAPEDV